MKILVTTDAHIFRTPDKKLWCKSIYKYSFWQRYLEVFDSVRIVARLKDVPEADSKWLRVDGKNIEVYGIPFYQGPIQLAKKYFKIKKTLNNVYDGCNVALFRMPSPTGQLVYSVRNKNILNIPIALEVVFDPTDSLNSKKGSVLKYLINIITARNLRKMCLSANGVSYVTSETIQKHFPSHARLYGEDRHHFETYYSSIALDNNAFAKPKEFENKTSFTLVHSDVSMNSERKGEPILLEALKLVRNFGFEVNAIFIGDGSLRKTFEKKAVELGVGDYVKFTGLLSSSDDVRKILINSDLYVFPTKAEGLPRGIIEAMSVGLPCVSSPVGGIPELIDKEYLANPKDAKAYADIIIKLISNPKLMEKISKFNIEKAKLFHNDILQMRRNQFYSKLKELAN